MRSQCYFLQAQYILSSLLDVGGSGLERDNVPRKDRNLRFKSFRSSPSLLFGFLFLIYRSLCLHAASPSATRPSGAVEGRMHIEISISPRSLPPTCNKFPHHLTLVLTFLTIRTAISHYHGLLCTQAATFSLVLTPHCPCPSLLAISPFSLAPASIYTTIVCCPS